MAATVTGTKTDRHYLASWFAVELDNGIKGSFTEVTGLAVEVAAIEMIDSSGDLHDTVTRQRPGTTAYTDLTVKRIFTGDRSFYDWVDEINKGKEEYRTDGAVVLYNIAGTVIGRWTFQHCWPSKWSISDLDVGSDDPVIEEVVLSCEGLKREQ